MMRALRKILFLLTLGVIISVASSHGSILYAQNNSKGIDDDLYAIYQRAYNIRKTPQAKLIADTLYHEAAIRKDYKAQALAMCIPIYYQFTQKDDEKMLKVVNGILDFCAAHNIESSYYFASINYVSYLLNRGHTYLALDFVKNCRNHAARTSSRYGQYYCDASEANIHFIRHEYDTAYDFYKKALNTSKGVIEPSVLSFTIYCRMAECCNFLGKHEDAIKYAKKGIEVAKTDHNRIRNSLELAIAYYESNRRDDFLKVYKDIEPDLSKITFETHRKNTVMIVNCLYNAQYDKAIEIASTVTPEATKYGLFILIYRQKGDYYNVLKYEKRLYDIRKKNANELIVQGIGDQEILNGSYVLRKKNQQLAIANTQMELLNSNLELKKVQDLAEAERIKTESNSLGIQHQKLESQRIKADMENKAIEQKKQEAAEEATKERMQLTLRGGIVVLILLIAYITYRIKMSRRIHKSNDLLELQNKQLAEAREKSELADRMKTMFIQNMSHEIRTPLNAIVGFSQLLAESGDDITKDEKKDFSNRIETSSGLVLNIINDILDLSSIESGNYKMEKLPALANEMCRTAMFNVEERVPAGVELKFSTEVDDGYAIVTDSKRVVQVIINFLTNATKNTTHGSIHLHCSTSERQGYLTFSVADTGIGVAPEKMDYIFKRFNKLDDFKQGAGLGLSICTIIADRLNGLIYIDKNYTGGARFVFAIPRQS